MKRNSIFSQQRISSIMMGMIFGLFFLGLSQETRANGGNPNGPIGGLKKSPYGKTVQPRWGGNSDAFVGAVGIQVGTYGFGAHYFQPFGAGQQFGVRLGIGFMPIKTSLSGNYGGRDTESDVKASFNNADLHFSWFPLKAQDNFLQYFSINAGAVYLFKLEGEGTTRLKEGYQMGDITVSPEDVGVIKTTVDWERKVNPAVGLGFNNIRLNSNLALSANLGCAFLSSPKVSMEANGLLANNTGNTATIQENMKNYKYLPKLEVGISYLIK